MSKRNLCIISGLLVGISAFLPYFSVSFFGSTMSRSLADRGDLVIVIIITVIAVACALMEKYIPVIIAGIASFILFFSVNANMTSALDTGNSMSTELAKSMIQNSAGYYCLLIGAIALVVFGILGQMDNKGH